MDRAGRKGGRWRGWARPPVWHALRCCTRCQGADTQTRTTAGAATLAAAAAEEEEEVDRVLVHALFRDCGPGGVERRQRAR